MSAITQFLVRWGDGKMYTIAEPRIGIKSAAKLFAVRYNVAPGERFGIKIRSQGDWEFYVRTVNGIRQVEGM